MISQIYVFLPKSSIFMQIMSVPVRKFGRFPRVSPQVAQARKRGNDRIRIDQPTPIITIDYF